MSKSFKTLVVGFAAGLLAVSGYIVREVYLYTRGNTIEFKGQTEILAEPLLHPKVPKKVVLIAKAGNRGRVLGIDYSKDFMFYRVRLEDWTKGYVVAFSGSDSLYTIAPQPAAP